MLGRVFIVHYYKWDEGKCPKVLGVFRSNKNAQKCIFSHKKLRLIKVMDEQNMSKKDAKIHLEFAEYWTVLEFKLDD